MRAGATNTNGERLSDQAFETLHNAITRCDLAPGEIVSEPQIEQKFGLGRVGIRLAMDRLIQLQLVRPIHRRGFEIAPIRIADVRNTFELRLLIEPPSVKIATKRGVNLDRLREINQRTLGTAKPGDKAAEAIIIDANREFHLRIVEACGNDKVVSLMRQVLSDIDRVYYYGLMQHPQFSAMQQQHCRMIDAIAAGDGDEAARIAREHIEAGYGIVMDSVMQNVSFGGASLAAPMGFGLGAKSRGLLD